MNAQTYINEMRVVLNAFENLNARLDQISMKCDMCVELYVHDFDGTPLDICVSRSVGCETFNVTVAMIDQYENCTEDEVIDLCRARRLQFSRMLKKAA